MLIDKIKKISIPYINCKPESVPVEDEITAFEKENNVKIPRYFREMLHKLGGFEADTSFGSNEYSKLILPLTKGKFGYDHIMFSCTRTFAGMKKYFQHDIDIPKNSLVFNVGDGGSLFINLWKGVEGQIYRHQADYDYSREDEIILVEESDEDDFDPITGNIPYTYTKIADSFSEFVEQLLFVDGEKWDAMCENRNGKALEITNITRYELPKGYFENNDK